MRYAVAHMSFFDSDLRQIAVYANDPITALINGVRELLNSPENDEWLDPMLENIPASYLDWAARIEEIQEEFFNADQVVSVIVADD